MILPLYSDQPPLDQTEDGVVRISGTRIPLERVIRAFSAGATPEQIVHDFDVLAIEDVYAVINYYLHHRGEVDAYLTQAEAESVENRNASQPTPDPSDFRARLLARRLGPKE